MRRRGSIAAAAARAAGLAAFALIAAASGRGVAMEQTADWLEALRSAPMGAWNSLPLPQGPAQPGEAERKPALAVLTFEADSAALTDPTRRTLDGLAAALTSSDLYAMAFEVQWYAEAKRTELNTHALPQRRAAEIYAYLQARPGITLARVMLRAALRKPAEAPPKLPTDSIVIRVVNRGPL
jgi:outer membrane protein OmpA-like peptidoglycan-associated protein